MGGDNTQSLFYVETQKNNTTSFMLQAWHSVKFVQRPLTLARNVLRIDYGYGVTISFLRT
jgi:hypothetical protein